MTTAPEGFVLSRARGPFSTHNGPYYHREVDDGVEQAFFATDRHCNAFGLVHGGMMAAFMDGLLAGGAARGREGVPVTVSLTLNYLDSGRAGDWVFGAARTTRATRDIVFVEGRIFTASRELARASGVFKLLPPRKS